MENISFFYEYKNFVLDKEDPVSDWVLLVINAHQAELGEVNYIFVSDDYLLQLNKQFLSHDYYTDILTFPHEEAGETISADIYISVDRVQENAINHGGDIEEELHRVMIHGILHLLGFDDHGFQEALMRNKEREVLNLRNF